MTIYGRTGDVVTIKRMATIEDVGLLERREPDAQDLEALENGSYVVVTQDDGKDRLYHQAFLRATRGSVEITEAIAELARVNTRLEDGLSRIGEGHKPPDGWKEKVLALTLKDKD